MSNLLDKASIILTPTAYNNGEALCVKPDDGSGDFQFSRNSAATRVNAQGLVENVQILSSNLVQNGDFSEEGVQEVSNGSFSQEGVQLITNGDFSSDTNWVKGAGWNISGGSANGSSTTGDLYQENVVEAGKYYKITYTISNYVSGSVRVELPNNAYAGTDRSANGTYTEILLSNGTIVLFDARTSFTGSIDNVSVREVGQNWTLQPSWGIAENKATSNGSGLIYQTSVSYIDGKTYKVTFDADITSGSGTVRLGNTTAATAFANGSNEFYLQTDASNTTRYIFFNGISLVGSITNISVKEVGQNWDLGTGWSIGDNIANAVDAAFNSQIVYSDNVVASKKYKVSFNVSNYVKGSVRVNIGNVGSDTVSSNGNFTFVLTSANTAPLIIQTWAGGSGTSLSITNISVIEITTDTNLPRINYEGFSYQDALGSELVVNGDFATDSDWTKQVGWSIENGKANALNSSQAIYQAVSFNSQKQYKISYTISNYVSGDLRFVWGNIVSATNNGNGTYTQIVSPTSGGLVFYLAAINSFTGSIDNVSVKEVTAQEVVPDSGCGSWLFEPQSTNLLLNSDNGSSYGVYSATKTLDEVISLDGTLNSFTLEGNGDTNQVLGYTANKTLSAGDYTFSVFAKKGTNDFIQLFFDGFSGSLNGAAYFDLENGTTPSSFGKIESYGNGWFRCSVVGTVVSGDLNGRFGFRISYTSSNFFFPTANDAIGKNAYFYGFQTRTKIIRNIVHTHLWLNSYT